MTDVTKRRTLGIAAALFAVALWAAWIPVTRFGVVTRLSAWDVAALRFGTAGLLLAPVLLRRWREVPWRRFGALVAMICGGGVPYVLAFGKGLAIANSGQGAVLGPGANSALVTLFAFLALRERPPWQRWVGLAITLSGVAFVLLHDVSLGGVRIGGFALVLCASSLWAAYTIGSRVLMLDPLTSTAVVSVVNAAIYVPLYLAFDGGGHLAAAPLGDLLLQAGYQGVITAIVAMIVYAYAVQWLGATGAASFTPLSPVLAAAFGWLVLGDTIDVATAGGLALVVAGVLFAARAPAATKAAARAGRPVTAAR